MQSFASTIGAARYIGLQTSHPYHHPRDSAPFAPSCKCADGTPAGPVPEPARKSWIYGAATEVRSELQAVKEDAEAWSVHQDPGQPQREGIVTHTDAFRRRGVDSGLGSEEVHHSRNGGMGDMTFAAGGTLQRLLSSASVSIGKRAQGTAKPDSTTATISGKRSGSFVGILTEECEEFLEKCNLLRREVLVSEAIGSIADFDSALSTSRLSTVITVTFSMLRFV